MKNLFLTVMILGLATLAQAQNATSSASQGAKLSLSNAVAITFLGTGATTGGLVTLPFSTTGDYADGVTSAGQMLMVQSNKGFKISVKANSSRFTYSGSVSPAPRMPVSNVLRLKVTANNTGGSIASTFGTAFKSLSSSTQTLINNGTYGGNKTFEVTYQATPGFAYPAGDYTVNIVYTVTQQ